MFTETFFNGAKYRALSSSQITVQPSSTTLGDRPCAIVRVHNGRVLSARRVTRLDSEASILSRKRVPSGSFTAAPTPAG